MLKRRLCEAAIEWSLRCEGPLLIADGRYEKQGKDADAPDKVFISRAANARQLQVQVAAARGEAANLDLPFYVPGTSLRGPLRSQAELIVRSLAPDETDAPTTACDPFENEKEESRSCSSRMDEKEPKVPYAEACPACKLFGCTGTASRVRLIDADLAPGRRSVFRDMIGIDRFTGGVHHGANMRFHALEGAAFATTVTVQNFELWHLGLLAYALQDFADGRVAIGAGKSKGFGQVRGTVESVTLTYPKGRAEGRVEHLGSLASAAEREKYGLHDEEPPAYELEPVAGGGFGLYDSFRVADLDAFWQQVAPAFNRFLERRFGEEEA